MVPGKDEQSEVLWPGTVGQPGDTPPPPPENPRNHDQLGTPPMIGFECHACELSL